MASLNVRYSNGGISEEKYYEIKMIIGNEFTEIPSMIIAKQRFINLELSSKEFIKTRDIISSNNK